MSMPPVRHTILLPTYNSGPLAAQTLEAILGVWDSVFVIIDGSTDGSEKQLETVAGQHAGVELLRLRQNSGKGAAFLEGARRALERGFTHGLVMDADGQHPTDWIPAFVALSKENPDAMILGTPLFGPDAPGERVHGRRIGNGFAELETFWGGIRDSLFGFRLLPLRPAVEVMESIRTARRFDFDTELAVRLYWKGVPPINVPVPVYYPPRATGGVTHFHYLRDNLLLAGTHTRLFFGMLARIPKLWKLRKRNRSRAAGSSPRRSSSDSR